jgi:hypothetical protein
LTKPELTINHDTRHTKRAKPNLSIVEPEAEIIDPVDEFMKDHVFTDLDI